MTVKIDYFYVGHIVGGNVRCSLVLNTRKFSDAVEYCKSVKGEDTPSIRLIKGRRFFEVDTPEAVRPAIEAWAAKSYPGADVLYLEHAPVEAAAPANVANSQVFGHTPVEAAANRINER